MTSGLLPEKSNNHFNCNSAVILSACNRIALHIGFCNKSIIRATGFSLAYSLATVLFGGFTPLIATWLIETTGDKASPGYWMAMAGGMGLIATVLIYKGIVKARD
jgi:hypothetical protein